MTEDYAITTGGTTIRGRDAFKAWVGDFQRRMPDATNETLEVFANRAGDLVVSRWVCRGHNGGMFGLPPDGRAIEFTGIAIWRVSGGRLAECWVFQPPNRRLPSHEQAHAGCGRMRMEEFAD